MGEGHRLSVHDMNVQAKFKGKFSNDIHENCIFLKSDFLMVLDILGWLLYKYNIKK